MGKKTATDRAKQAAKEERAKHSGKKMDGGDLPNPLPTQVTLLSPYGFLDDDGALNMWAPGQVVEDADEILILLERDAPITFEAPVAVEATPAPASAPVEPAAPAIPAPAPAADPAPPADEPAKTE